jgi:hypothetical protein
MLGDGGEGEELRMAGTFLHKLRPFNAKRRLFWRRFAIGGGFPVT